MLQRNTLVHVDNSKQQGKVIIGADISKSLIVSSFMRPDELLLQNPFSDRLSPLGFNLFSIFLPDLMHKVELGGWKVIFIHLLRMLQSIDEERLVELDWWCLMSYFQGRMY